MKKKMKFTLLIAMFLLIGWVVIICNSCKKEKAEIKFKDPVYIQNDSIKSNVSTINTEEAKLISDSAKLSQGIYEFQFNGNTPNYKTGDVIVGQANQGFLRKVVSASASGSTYVVQSEQATLEDLFKDAKINFQMNLSDKKAAKTQNSVLQETKINYLANGVHVQGNGLTYDFSNTIIYQNGPITFKISSGKVTFNPNYVFDIDISSSKINRIAFYADNADLNVDCNLNLNATQKVQLADHTEELADIDKKFLTWVGLVPVVVVVNTKLKAKLTADINAEFNATAGFTDNFKITLGAVYENNEWTGRYGLTPTFTSKPVAMSGTVKLSQNLTITPEVSVKLYGVAGPYCIPEMWEQFNANIASPSLDWDALLKVGINTTVGADITIFSRTLANYSKTFTIDNELWKAPAQITKISGDKQSGKVNQTLTEPIKIKVSDNINNPLKNVVVYFTISQGGGSANPTSVLTDANGFAETIWKLGSDKSQELKVQVKTSDGIDISGSPLTFTATTAEPYSIEIVSGDNQLGVIGSELSDPVKVIVKDQQGNPFAGAKVNFSANNDGTVSKKEVLTGADGTASVTWTMGNIDFTQTVTVTAFKSDNTTPLQGSPLTFTATSGNEFEVDVFADWPGTSTSLYVKSGDVVSFTASGNWCWSSGNSCCNANGTSVKPNADEHPVTLEPLNFGVLIGRIVGLTQSSAYFKIGTSASINITTDGEIQLLMNDRLGAYADNSGYLSVVIKIVRGMKKL
jgi:hypothetical protein